MSDDVKRSERQSNTGGTETPATGETLRLDPASRSLQGQRLGEYELREAVGHGGMGVVYRAYEPALDRTVAIKVLPPHLSVDPDFQRRFDSEAKVAAKLDHPGVVQVFAAGKAGEQYFIAMQFVEGRTLAALLKEHRRLPWREALGIARQVAEALGAAHRLGLIHRDIKPGNIMCAPDGRVKVMDFGLSRSFVNQTRVTEAGIYLGTPEYSSPEQCESNDLDGRTDLYSLGVVLYEMLSGRVPHVAETPLSLFKKICEEPPRPLVELIPDVPPSVAAIVDRALAKSRDARYPDAAAFVSDIDKALGGATVAAGFPATTRATDFSLPPRRSSWAPWGVAVAAALLVGFTAWAMVGHEPVMPGEFTRPDSPFAHRPPPPPVPGGGGIDTPGIAVANTAPLPIAVFDFKNATGAEEARWMEIGIPEMLIANLLQCPQLAVIPRDELIAHMREIAGRRVSVIDPGAGETQHSLVLTPETSAVLRTCGAKALVSGSFFAIGGDVRAIAYVYAYTDPESEQASLIGQETLTLKKSEVMKLVDRMSEVVIDILRKKAPALLPGTPQAYSFDARKPVEECVLACVQSTMIREYGEGSDRPAGRRGAEDDGKAPPAPSAPPMTKGGRLTESEDRIALEKQLRLPPGEEVAGQKVDAAPPELGVLVVADVVQKDMERPGQSQRPVKARASVSEFHRRMQTHREEMAQAVLEGRKLLQQSGVDVEQLARYFESQSAWEAKTDSEWGQVRDTLRGLLDETDLARQAQKLKEISESLKKKAAETK